MLKLKIGDVSAIAPQIVDADSWAAWLLKKEVIGDVQRLNLKQIPPLLRRRFSPLGKYAAAAALSVTTEDNDRPTIFSSRHGNTALSWSLLTEIAKKEPMSPTDFSLAVHNAVGGLLSIARKNTAPITAISSMNSLALSTLQEAIAQLEIHDSVLCVIYDEPLPEAYQCDAQTLPFPVAVAFTIKRSEDDYNVLLTSDLAGVAEPLSDNDALFDFIALLMGINQSINIHVGNNSHWNLKWAG